MVVQIVSLKEISMIDLRNGDKQDLLLQIIDTELYRRRFDSKFLDRLREGYRYTDEQFQLVMQNINRESTLLALKHDLMY